MASGNTNANSFNSGSNKEQLLVCWLEPQSDAGKVSAIPISWVVSTVSGDGRSEDSVVRCRWPRTRRLYRARIVSSGTNKEENENEVEVEGEPEAPAENQKAKEEPTKLQQEEICGSASPDMVKEELKSTRNSHSSTPLTMNFISAPIAGLGTNTTNAASTIDAGALAQALLPTLKKIFNTELSKLSSDIQANFDIVGHKISALDGTVKCIKTRVDRMEVLLNTAAQELGDPEGLTSSSTGIGNLNMTSANHRSFPMNNADFMAGPNRRSSCMNTQNDIGGFQTPQQRVLGGMMTGFMNSRSAQRSADPTINSTLANSMNVQQLQHRRQQRQQNLVQNRFGTSNSVGSSHSQTPKNNRVSTTATVSSYPKNLPLSMVTTAQRSQFAATVSSPLKRHRPSQADTMNPPLPKAAVITAPNGVEIYLGGDKNYKMPLVMYKDALKNCTRPSPTYMVMALVRRFLTPDEMSRTWLTEQQLLGKKDGMLMDQNLLAALKNQALMQFPGSNIDDRLLVRKLYDVFHGIRRQMRKKLRGGGEVNFGTGDPLLSCGGMDGNGYDDGDSGSGNEQLNLMEDDFHGMEYAPVDGDDQGHHFDDDFIGGDAEAEMDGDGDGNGDGLGEGPQLNGDEDLEEMAARQAAFWAGADDNF